MVSTRAAGSSQPRSSAIPEDSLGRRNANAVVPLSARGHAAYENWADTAPGSLERAYPPDLRPALDCSIVVPVYRGARTLRELHSRLVEALEGSGMSFEVIFVDDCSRDASWSVIEAISQEDSRVLGIQLMRNSGQPAATMAGMARARGALVVTMDDDLQNPPHEVPRLVRFMADNPEVDAAFGCPREKHYAVWRRLGSYFVNRLSSAMFGQARGFKLTSFRIMRREVVLPLLRLNVFEPPIGALLATLTTRMVNVDVDHVPRAAGRSTYSLRKLVRVSLSKFLGFSSFPLRFLATMGILGIVGSLLFGAYIMYRYVFGNIAVPGWTTLSLLLLGLSGFTFLGFGIIGEYLHQILSNTRQNPAFLVRRSCGSPGFEPHSADVGVRPTSPVLEESEMA
ncbi:MAG: glycosyltransferase family 2 protein [Deltaproteobacteria bacterium]|nr:glycosyltransferase family 2 protein [Deltaproteobacteria bacterium]